MSFCLLCNECTAKQIPDIRRGEAFPPTWPGPKYSRHCELHKFLNMSALSQMSEVEQVYVILSFPLGSPECLTQDPYHSMTQLKYSFALVIKGKPLPIVVAMVDIAIRLQKRTICLMGG